jgi:hypothetical protein
MAGWNANYNRHYGRRKTVVFCRQLATLYNK